MLSNEETNPDPRFDLVRYLFDQYEECRATAIATGVPADDADDVVMIAARNLIERKPSSGEIRNPAAYIQSVVHNAAIDWLRHNSQRLKRSITGADLEALLACKLPTPEEEALLEEKRSVVRECIDQLSEKCRNMLTWEYFEYLTMHEIAELLHLSDGTVRNKQHDCKMKLKELISRRLGLGDNTDV